MGSALAIETASFLAPLKRQKDTVHSATLGKPACRQAGAHITSFLKEMKNQII